MDHHTVVDRLVRELRKQAETRPASAHWKEVSQTNGKFLAITKGRDPDTFFVVGLIDIDHLARAVNE